MADSKENGETGTRGLPAFEPQSVLFAKTPDSGKVIGVVCDARPSSLALLAAGVAGLAARRALYQRRK